MNLKYLLQICLRMFKENKSVGKWNQITILDENDNVIRPAILWNDGRTFKETVPASPFRVGERT